MTKKPRAVVFIDGANVFYTQKHLGWSVDWKKVKGLLAENYELTEIRYYTGIKNHDEKMKRFLNWLRKIKFKTITKPLKIIKDQADKTIYKSNCDVEMAVDIILSVNDFDVLVLFSGDSDFVYLIKVLQGQFQKKAVVYSSRKTVSWELKLAANKYFFLEDIKRQIKK